MRNRLLHSVVTLVFAGIIVGVVIANRLAGQSAGPMPGGAADALRRYGFALQEVSRASGIDFVHQAPHLDPKLHHIMPEVASMGTAVSVVDYDKDGLPDLYVCDSTEGGQNHLYHNLGNGRFEDVAAKLGVADLNRPGTGVSMGAVWGDYDNDGYEDLLVYQWGRPRLFHNDGGKGFTDVTDTAGLPRWVNANTATWVDYDRDGKLDLLLCGYYPDDVNLWHLSSTRMMPDSFEYAQNGGRKYLLHNLGGGRFEDVTAQMGITSHRWTLAVTAADLRGTGYPDLILANDYGYTEIYENEAGKRFREVGQSALYWGVGTGPKSGMNASVGDVMNSGQYAVYISNITAPGNLVQGNNLWVRDDGAPAGVLRYKEMATELGVMDGGWSFGAQFGDLNNDGALDLVLTNGYVSASKSKDYWYDFGTIAGGHQKIISDAKDWPSMYSGGQVMSLSGYEHKRVWLNDGYGQFTDVAQAVGYTDQHDGRAVALADLWNRGALDVIVANQNGPLLVYRNTVDPARKWIEFDLQGTRSNRSAIGAQVTLYWKDDRGRAQKQVQEVAGASGFCAQNDHRLHFGLGAHPQIEKAMIRWPIGGENVQTIPASSLQLNKNNVIKEPS